MIFKTDGAYHVKKKNSSMKMYLALIGDTKDHKLFQGLWKCAGRISHKIFFWLLLHDRVNKKSAQKEVHAFGVL